MNDYTPTTDEVLSCYRLPMSAEQRQREGESFAEFLSRRSIETMQQQIADQEASARWLAEVERAASEKAYERGRVDEHHDCKITDEYLAPGGPDLDTYLGNLRSRNPYRKDKTDD